MRVFTTCLGARTVKVGVVITTKEAAGLLLAKEGAVESFLRLQSVLVALLPHAGLKWLCPIIAF